MKDYTDDRLTFDKNKHRNPTVCEVGRKILADGKTRFEILRFPRGTNFDCRPCYISFNPMGGPV